MPLYCDLHAMGEQGHLRFSPFLLQKRVLGVPRKQTMREGQMSHSSGICNLEWRCVAARC